MARLPNPGSDNGVWGDILNDFLSVSHDPDGTIKASVLPAATPDATSSTKGKIQLTGDLGGTASSPTVPGLASKIATTIATTKGDLLAATSINAFTRLGVGADGQVLTADSTQSTGIKWDTPASMSINNVIAYGAAGDARRVMDAAVAAASATLTSTTASFTADDVGKTIVVWGAGASGGTLLTTITARSSATTVTLAVAASATVSSATIIFGTDSSAAFAAAVAALPSEGGAIYMPAGRYLLSTALTHTKRILWKGDGGGARPDTALASSQFAQWQLFNATHVWWVGSPDDIPITCDAHGSAFVDWCLDNGSDASPVSGTGLAVTKGYYNRYQNFTVANFYDDIDIQNGSEWVAENCTIYNPVNVGLKIANSTHIDEGDMSLVSCKFVVRDRTAYAAIQWTNAGGMLLTNCKFNNDFKSDGNKDIEWRRCIDAPITAWTSILMASNCSFENYAEVGIQLETDGNPFGNIKVTGCEFLAIKGTYEPRAIYVIGDRAGGGTVTGVAIDNNVMNAIGGSANPAIQLVDCDRVAVGAGNALTGWNLLVGMSGCTGVTPTHIISPSAPDVSNLGHWIKPEGQQIVSNEQPTLDRMFLVPITIGSAYYPLRLAAGTTVGQTGAVVRLALYADNGIGQPTGSPLGTTGAIAAETNYGVTDDVVTLAPGLFGQTPGLYWIGVVFQASGTAPTTSFARTSSPAFSSQFAAEHVFDDRTCYSVDGVTGAPGVIGSLNARTTAPAVSIKLS